MLALHVDGLSPLCLSVDPSRGTCSWQDRAPEVSALQHGNDPTLREEREAEWAVADSNHDVLLEIPEILPSLVRILRVSLPGQSGLQVH